VKLDLKPYEQLLLDCLQKISLDIDFWEKDYAAGNIRPSHTHKAFQFGMDQMMISLLPCDPYVKMWECSSWDRLRQGRAVAMTAIREKRRAQFGGKSLC